MSPMQKAGEKPIFEVWVRIDGGVFQQFKIWRDGGIDGFPPNATIVSNGIPTAIALACATERSRIESAAA